MTCCPKSGCPYSDNNLAAETNYCYRVRAYNASDNSNYSNEDCATTLGQSVSSTSGNDGGSGGGGGGGGGGGCFIATAAYGTPLVRQVRILSQFKDEYLLTNTFGKRFVKLYYQHSPPIAEYIAEREFLRELVRIALWPLVGFGLFILKLGLLEKIGVGMIFLMAIGYLLRQMRLKGAIKS